VCNGHLEVAHEGQVVYAVSVGCGPCAERGNMVCVAEADGMAAQLSLAFATCVDCGHTVEPDYAPHHIMGKWVVVCDRCYAHGEQCDARSAKLAEEGRRAEGAGSS